MPNMQTHLQSKKLYQNDFHDHLVKVLTSKFRPGTHSYQLAVNRLGFIEQRQLRDQGKTTKDLYLCTMGSQSHSLEEKSNQAEQNVNRHFHTFLTVQNNSPTWATSGKKNLSQNFVYLQFSPTLGLENEAIKKIMKLLQKNYSGQIILIKGNEFHKKGLQYSLKTKAQIFYEQLLKKTKQCVFPAIDFTNKVFIRAEEPRKFYMSICFIKNSDAKLFFYEETNKVYYQKQQFPSKVDVLYQTIVNGRPKKNKKMIQYQQKCFREGWEEQKKKIGFDFMGKLQPNFDLKKFKNNRMVYRLVNGKNLKKFEEELKEKDIKVQIYENYSHSYGAKQFLEHPYYLVAMTHEQNNNNIQTIRKIKKKKQVIDVCGRKLRISVRGKKTIEQLRQCKLQLDQNFRKLYADINFEERYRNIIQYTIPNRQIYLFIASFYLIKGFKVENVHS